MMALISQCSVAAGTSGAAGAPTTRDSYAAKVCVIPGVKWAFSERVPLISIDIFLILGTVALAFLVKPSNQFAMSYRYPSRVFNGGDNAGPLGSLGLTPREAQVLTWIAQGKTNYEIGVKLRACTGTIRKHVERILAKLNVQNRTAAAVVAIAALANTKK